jgi:tetratricopeptide (TPR) repeat protein
MAKDPGHSQSLGASELIRRAERCQTEGKFDEAGRHYQSILRQDGRHFGALYGLCTLRASQGKLPEAERYALLALATNPKSIEARNNLGLIYGKLGRIEEAAAQFRQILASQPHWPPALRGLGIAQQALGDRPAAAECFAAVVKADPRDSDARGALGALLLDLGRPAEAFAQLEGLLAIHPDDAAAWSDLGFALNCLGRTEEAVKALERAVALRPNHAVSLYNLGCGLHSLRRFEEAVKALERARSLKPDWFEVHHNLGLALQALGRFREAAESHNRSVQLQPNSDGGSTGGAAVHAFAQKVGLAEAFNSLGLALHRLNDSEKATAAYRKSIELDPSCVAARYNFGNQLTEMGEFEAAQEQFRHAIELDPKHAGAHRSMANVRRFSEDDGRLSALEALALDLGSLSESDQIEVHFALGKAYGDLGRHEESFEHLIAGNALKRKTVCYDEEAILGLAGRIKAELTAERMREKAGLGDPSDLPIFILGMPRSGTSLVEQVLASHPDVHGAGELAEFESAAKRIVVGGRNPALSPEVISALGEPELRSIGSAYVQALQALSPGAKRITDKLPANFWFVGLIRLALPGARIIHVNRDPVDTCVSCFSQLFNGDSLPCTYDLRELGRYYRAYQTLMDHWRAVLGREGMFEVRYEALVEDLETDARRMLEYCGLPWNDACLSFYKTRRSVKTASFVAVRQPVYRSSVGRAAAVSRFLKPLREELGMSAPEEQVSQCRQM